MSEPLQYRFFCIICGTPFTPVRAHATTCKLECRVIHAAINKKWILQVADSDKTPIDKTEVAEGYKKVTGREIPKAAIDQYPAKKEEPTTAAGKLLGKKRAADPATAPAEEPEEEINRPLGINRIK